jgi:hypothetical protein
MRAALPPQSVVERVRDIHQMAVLWRAIARRTCATRRPLRAQTTRLRMDSQTRRQVQDA